jgi:hypothetical protein
VIRIEERIIVRI